MNDFIVIITILFLVGIGYLLIKLFGLLSSQDVLTVIGYSYGLGVGVIVLQLFIYSQLHIPWEKEMLISPWLIVAIIAFIKKKNNIRFYIPKTPKLSMISVLLICGIIFTCCYVVFEALLRPATAMDTWGFWLFQSKAFFLAGHFDSSIFKITNIDYPPIMYLLGTFIYIVLGKVDDTAVLLTSFGFYLSLALLFFAVIKRRYGDKYALIFTFLLVTTQTFIRQGGRLEAGLADLPIGYYEFICLTLLLQYIKTDRKKILVLMNIFLGIIGLVKFDGLPFVFISTIFVLYHIYKKRLFNHLPLLLLWVLPLGGWPLYKKINHISPAYFSDHRLEISLHKTINSFSGTIMALINIKSWNMLWIIYFFSFFVLLGKKSYEQVILNSIIFSQLIIYILLYIFTAGNAPSSSIERLLVHIAPLTLFYVAIFIRLLDKNFLN